MVSSHYLEWAFLEHWDMASWVYLDVSRLLIVALQRLNLVKDILLATELAACDKTPGLVIQDISVNCQVLR